MTDFVHPEVHKPYQSKNRYDILPTEVVERIRELEYPSKDFALQFKKNFKCNVLEQRNVNTKYKSEDVLVFELVGIDAAVANALRRILLSEVPTMAIKTVYFHDNSSIVQDEVLAHRLGLVPLKVDPNHFYDLQNEDEKTDYNTLVYKLDVTCRRKPNMDMNKTSAEGEETLDVDYNALEHGIVYASDLEWQPCGTQEERLNKVAPRPVNEDIVLAKLRPGQKIHLEVHAVRGVGKTHAKFSPVCTAHYRMMPEVVLIKPVYDEKAELLMRLMPGVFELESVPESEKKSGNKKKAVVKSPINCTMSRNFMQDEELASSVRVSRIPDHFIFSIESVGQLPAAEIFRRAIAVLKKKCSSTVESIKRGGGD
jgi:DNA-directed RNA polymerases I and III subunit RPAC1|eukprot:g5794.t1